MSMITDRNLAEEYARTFGLPEQAINEEGAEFRERIARTLFDMGEKVYAHEALWNERMSIDPFARGSLSRGYGDAFITEIASNIEASYQAAQQYPVSPIHRIIRIIIILIIINIIITCTVITAIMIKINF